MLLSFPFLNIPSVPILRSNARWIRFMPFPGVDSSSVRSQHHSDISEDLPTHHTVVHFPNLSQSPFQRKQAFLPLHNFIMSSMSSLSKTLHNPITTREYDGWDVEDVVVYWCWACHFFAFLPNSSNLWYVDWFLWCTSKVTLFFNSKLVRERGVIY